jgi:hypothetical protein
MTSQGYLSFLDYDGERSAMSVITGDITAVSLPGFLTQWGALRTATADITIGTITEEAAYVFKTKLANVKPTSENAQRERKWLVTYEDSQDFFDPGVEAIPNAGYRKVFNIEIPTADPVGRLKANTDQADLENEDIAAWITAFEAIARSPYGGTVNVLEITLVGRNL